ncbi:hypothetical protein ACRAWF_21775 [Streptomyces sp. L7]
MDVDSLTAAFAYSSEALAMIPAEPPSRTWVWAAATHVLTARQVGEDEIALRVAQQALRTAEELQLVDARADLLISLATLEKGGRRTKEGRERLAQARELARQAGHAPVEMRALFHLAIGNFESGHLEESLPWLTEGLDRARRAGLLSSAVPAGDALPPAPGAVHARPLGRVREGRHERCEGVAADGRLHHGTRAVCGPGARRLEGRRPGACPAGGAVRLDGGHGGGHRADRRRWSAGRSRRRPWRRCARYGRGAR